MKRFALLGMLLVACQTGGTLEVEDKCSIVCPAPEPTLDAGSKVSPYGTRLAPLLISFGDGTKIVDPLRLYDTERDEPCSFTRIEGGPARCLPAFEWNVHPGMFEDSACTKPVASFPMCAELPRYVRDDSSAPWMTCEPRKLEALFPLGEPLPVGALLYDLNSGPCASHTTADAANAYMPILEHVELDAFVEGDEGP